MLEGFIKLNERDIDYMDRYMDPLFDFMEPGSDTEELIHRYYDYIATFDPQEAKERYDDMEEHLGYKTHIVFAAGLLAKELHTGQKDNVEYGYGRALHLPSMLPTILLPVY